MTDITNTHLAAAIIDQKVAGAFHGKAYAFLPIVAPGGWALGVAVANEQGYSPLAGKSFTSMEDARFWAGGLNRHLGWSDEDAIRIIISTMGGRRFAKAEG